MYVGMVTMKLEFFPQVGCVYLYVKDTMVMLTIFFPIIVSSICSSTNFILFSLVNLILMYIGGNFTKDKLTTLVPSRFRQLAGQARQLRCDIYH